MKFVIVSVVVHSLSCHLVSLSLWVLLLLFFWHNDTHEKFQEISIVYDKVYYGPQSDTQSSAILLTLLNCQYLWFWPLSLTC